MKRKVLVCFLLLLGISLVACNKNKHEAKSEWKWNDEQHWHECATKKHDDKLDEADHEFGEGVITTEPTETTEGVKTFSCTVCGYQKTESVEKLTHTHGFANEWTINEARHWHASACGHSDKLEEADHSWNEGVIIAEPTETTEGVKAFSCVVCGYQKTESIGKHTHTWDEGIITFPTYTTTAGVKTCTCTVCGTTKTETIDNLDLARFNIKDVFSLSTIEEIVVTGNVVSGTIKENDTLKLYGEKGTVTVTVAGIEVSDARVTSVTPEVEGDVALLLGGVSKSDIASGDLLITSTVDIQKAKLITVSLYLKTSAEGGKTIPIFANYTPNFLLGTKTNNATLVSFSGNATENMVSPGETVTATFLLKNADYMFVGDSFKLNESNKEVAIGQILSVDGIAVKAESSYETGDVDISKTVYVNADLAAGEWKIIMDTEIATYKVYDSAGSEIDIEDDAFTLSQADTVTVILTPVDGGGVDTVIIQKVD